MGSSFMGSEITGKPHWTQSPVGQYLLAWEQQRCDEAVSDIFGYHSLQLGLPMLHGLRNNRMPQRWLAVDTPQAQASDWPAALLADAAALPFAAASLDLVLMPHTLDGSPEPHAVLREAARVLVPDGHLVICGLNPWSLWGVQRRMERGNAYLRGLGWGMGYWRLRDWLQLQSFDIEAVRFGCWCPAAHDAQWLRRWQFMERWGRRLWPVLGAAYCLVAVKRTAGMRIIAPQWRAPRPRATAAAAQTRGRDEFR